MSSRKGSFWSGLPLIIFMLSIFFPMTAKAQFPYGPSLPSSQAGISYAAGGAAFSPYAAGAGGYSPYRLAAGYNQYVPGRSGFGVLSQYPAGNISPYRANTGGYYPAQVNSQYRYQYAQNPYGQYQNPYSQYPAPYGQQNLYGQQNPFGQYANPYGQYQNPYGQYSNPYGQPYPYGQYPYGQYQTGQQFQATDESLTESNDGDDITIEEGDTIGIILSTNITAGYKWVLDTDELDDDIVEKKSSQVYTVPSAGYREQWIFEGADIGTTVIKLDYTGPFGSINNSFEVTVEVEE